MGPPRFSNITVGLAAAAGAVSLSAFTYFYVRANSGQSGFHSGEALPGYTAGVRGAYLNTGSRDVGPDHQNSPYIRYQSEQAARVKARDVEDKSGDHGHRAVTLPQAALAAVAALTLALDSMVAPLQAQAVLNSPNAQIARTVDAALRRSTPAFNAQVKDIQDKLENIQFQLRIPQRKPWGGMSKNARDSLQLVSDRTAMMMSVPPGKDEEAKELISSLQTQLEKLQFAIERKDIDRTSTTVASTLATVAKLEIVQAPALSFQVPQAYRNMPLLQGRATVEVVVEKPDGAPAFVDSARGGLLRQGKFEMTLDGFSAPVTAGAFAKLVKDAKYDGSELSTGYLTVVGGKGVSPGATVPLEILPIGEFEPVYRTPLETQQGELAVLPLSIKGACAMASLPDVDGYMAGDQFFIYLFDPQQSGLSGLSFDEGRFGVFGYITKGLDDTVTKLAAGDKIVQAKITSGLDKLVNG